MSQDEAQFQECTGTAEDGDATLRGAKLLAGQTVDARTAQLSRMGAQQQEPSVVHPINIEA